MDTKKVCVRKPRSGVVCAGIFFFAIYLCTLPTAAFTVTTGPSLMPDEHAVIGESVTADIEIIYEVSSMNEFITVYTDLGSASWDAAIIADGREMPIGTRSGRYLTVTGFELYNPGSSITKLQVHLEGTVPEYLASTTQADVITIEQIAGDGSTVLDSVSETIPIIDLAAVDAMRTETENDLTRFEEEINRAYAAGTDTSAAEEVAADVQDLIDASRQMDIRNAYATLSKAESILAAELAALTDSVTRNHFQNARCMIAAIEPAIADYRDAGGVDEQGILVVLSYRDNAEMLLVLADEKNSSGDEEGAQQYAVDAYNKADNARTYLVDMYTDAGLTIGEYMPDATVPLSSSPTSAPTSLQTVSVLDFSDSQQVEGIQEIDIEGIFGFFQVILDGCMGFIDFIQTVAGAFSETGN